jgi:hypothetical protein
MIENYLKNIAKKKFFLLLIYYQFGFTSHCSVIRSIIKNRGYCLSPYNLLINELFAASKCLCNLSASCLNTP